MTLDKENKILVTGADGFIGSHLCEMLVHKGYAVKALSQYNSFNYWGWLEDVDCRNDIEIVSGDVRDENYCKDIMKGVGSVFHLASLIGIPYSYIAPASYLDTNVKGTLNICQAALENDVEILIHTSTSEVYGTAKYVPIDENHPLQPQSPYSATKMAADALALSYYNTFGLPVIVARPFNTYGPRQSARAVIPTIISQLASGVEELNLGDLSPTRDFNFVNDTCRGFLELSECNQAIGEVFNIGSNYEISIRETAELIKNIIGSKASVVKDKGRIRPSDSEVFRLWCDNNKINKLTGFEPKYQLEDGLRLTVEWFLDPQNLAKYKSDIYNV